MEKNWGDTPSATLIERRVTHITCIICLAVGYASHTKLFFYITAVKFNTQSIATHN